MLLPVQVTFRNIENPGALDEYVRKEATKLERFYDRISSCRVIVERPQKAASSKLYHVRIDLGLPQGGLVVKHMPTLHGSLQDAKQEKSRREAKSVLVHKTPRRAIHEAFQEMGRRLQDYARRQAGAVKTRADGREGIVKTIFPDQGYGFLETPDGREIYFHKNDVMDQHFDLLRIGSPVSYAEEAGEKGPQASTVRVIHPSKQARKAAASVVVRKKAAGNPRRGRSR
jgi:cold shock CspA family protein/ribosome-associated translation inhibitor RaiA